jgi:2-dehydro-3-deoxy-D-gluconate 5-dehydrogenase
MMKNMFDLTDNVAIVTGGGSGIGLGMARGLAAHGATIVIADYHAERAAAAVLELQGLGATASALDVDVTDDDAVRAMIRETVKRHARLDILINNVGTNVRATPDELSIDDWRKVMDTNLSSAFLASHLAYPEMKKVGGGKIVNVASIMAIFANPLAPAYAASKGGIVQLTKSCAIAWAKDGIQVNAVLPGFVDTEMGRDARRAIPGLEERVVARTPAARYGRPDDLAGAAVFLCSSASDFVTGAAIVVDGGYSINGF